MLGAQVRVADYFALRGDATVEAFLQRREAIARGQVQAPAAGIGRRPYRARCERAVGIIERRGFTVLVDGGPAAAELERPLRRDLPVGDRECRPAVLARVVQAVAAVVDRTHGVVGGDVLA